MGDYLHGFLEGLSEALRGKNRQVIRIQVAKLGAAELGMLIALYERAVAMYAEYIHINAFHQPGVQAYKLAAKSVLALREKLNAAMVGKSLESGTAVELAEKFGLGDDAVAVQGWLDKAACNGGKVRRTFDAKRGEWVYSVK